MVADSPDVDPMPLDQDPVLLIQVLSRSLADRMMEDLAASGLGDVRESDGYVFQHLLPGPLPVGALADRLGITQQGASKALKDMEHRGLVRRVVDADDARVRLVGLTERAHDAVRSGRRTRREVAAEWDALLGDRQAAALRRMLARAADHLGSSRAVADRTIGRPD